MNYADKQRSDYVSNALANSIQVSVFAQVTSDEFIGRMEALRFCIRKLPVSPHVVSHSDLLLVTAEKIAEWETVAERGDVRLHGSGLLFVFAQLQNVAEENAPDIRRLRAPVTATYTCQLSVRGQKVLALCFRVNDGPFTFLLNP